MPTPGSLRTGGNNSVALVREVKSIDEKKRVHRVRIEQRALDENVPSVLAKYPLPFLRMQVFHGRHWENLEFYLSSATGGPKIIRPSFSPRLDSTRLGIYWSNGRARTTTGGQLTSCVRVGVIPVLFGDVHAIRLLYLHLQPVLQGRCRSQFESHFLSSPLPRIRSNATALSATHTPRPGNSTHPSPDTTPTRVPHAAPTLLSNASSLVLRVTSASTALAPAPSRIPTPSAPRPPPNRRLLVLLTKRVRSSRLSDSPPRGRAPSRGMRWGHSEWQDDYSFCARASCSGSQSHPISGLNVPGGHAVPDADASDAGEGLGRAVGGSAKRGGGAMQDTERMRWQVGTRRRGLARAGAADDAGGVTADARAGCGRTRNGEEEAAQGVRGLDLKEEGGPQDDEDDEQESSASSASSCPCRPRGEAPEERLAGDERRHPPPARGRRCSRRLPGSDSRSGSEGPGMSPASAGMHAYEIMQAYEGMKGMGMGMGMQRGMAMGVGMGMGMVYDAMASAAASMGMGMSPSMHPVMMYGSMTMHQSMHPSMGAKYEPHHAVYDLHALSLPLELNLGMGMGLGFPGEDELLLSGSMGVGWAPASPQHPAFHQYKARMVYEAQQQQQGMYAHAHAQQGRGGQGVRPRQYLHQPRRFP
ncbi:hypothetical protein DFH09DRAFT_1272788 [Mycena vulgaris]|nr:hypothetical protein DFH09DRAFT_1272788 [Mycena vulgaris]